MARGTGLTKKKGKRASAAKPKVGSRRAATPPREPDEYGAAGGMPYARQSVLGDRSDRPRTARELGWAEFDRQVQLLARQALPFKPEAVVGIAPGGVFVGGAIASALKAEFFPVRLTRRSRDSETRLPAGLSDEMPGALSKKRVLLVDDICSSGDSLELALRLARAAGAAKVKTAALVTRPACTSRPDFSAFLTDTFFVFPWDYQAVVEDERFETREPPRGGKGRRSTARGPRESGDDVVLGV